MRWSDEVNVPSNVKMHKVVLLDSSGSMQGDKYDVAELGVKQDYEACRKEFTDYLLVEFSIDNRKQLHDFTGNLLFKPYYSGTALYKTIYDVLSELINTKSKDDKVLIQIFTDGQDEHSPNYLSHAKDAIERCSALGWTVTFVGTKSDVELVQRRLSIDSTNTLVHDNTPKGVKMSFETYTEATSKYTKAVKKGESVTRGFFKSIK